MSTQWFPTDWDYTFTAGGKSYTFNSVNPSLNSPATPPGGLDLDVVWVGTGTAADFAGRDVKGKAVLIHSIPAPGSMGHSAAYERAMARAAEKGAAAIGVVYGISDNFAVWQGLGGQGEGGPGQQRPITTPGFFMGFKDGKVIRDLIGAEQSAKLKMKLSVDMKDGLTSSNVWGTLPGMTDENIIILAHQDGGIGSLLRANPFARLAPAERTVERKVMRVQRLEAQVAPLARQVLRVLLDLPFCFVLVGVDVADVHDAAAEVQCLLHGFRHAGPRARADRPARG